MLPPDPPVTGAILTDQIKSIDAKVRNIKSAGQSVPDEVIEDALARLETLLG